MAGRVKHQFLCFLFFLSISITSYGSKVTRFIENKGQWHQDVKFKASIPGGDIYVLKNKLKYVFYQKGKEGHNEHFDKNTPALRSGGRELSRLFHAIEVSFENASSMSLTKGTGSSPEQLNYFIGNKSEHWATGVKSYTTVVIENLYIGIDFVIYSNDQGLKYDFIVSPGADPTGIRMNYKGQNELKIHDGRLVVGTVHGYFFENEPLTYSETASGKIPVRAEYTLENSRIGFNLPDGYDDHQKLVIDPELIFSTFSGSAADNWGFTATFDDEGNLYSGGIVNNVGYPVTNGVYQSDHGGEWDVGILKYDSTGKKLLWATYLGGDFTETPQSIIVNKKGELVIYGTTSSPDFPMTDNSFQKSFMGGYPIYDTAGVQNPRLVGGVSFRNGSDIFLAILGNDGSTLNGATFIGGTDNDGIIERLMPLTNNYGDQFRGEVILDEDDNIFVASNTSSQDFPISKGPQLAYGGGSNDGVIMKFNQDLSDMYWSTFIGGSGIDALFSIKIDNEGNAYAAGGTNSVDFPTTEGTIKTGKPLANDVDGIVVKIRGDGSELLKGTYIGTPEYDQVYFLELDTSGGVYLLGQTKGKYLVTEGVYSNPNSGQFIHKLGSDLDTTYFSTVIGSGSRSPDISPTAFLVNECENIFISGWGGVLNHPAFGYIGGSTFGLPLTENAFQKETDGTDFYLMVLLQDAEQLLYGTFFGETNGRGDHVDGGTSRFDKKGIVYQSVCGGCGGSSGFPTWPPDVWSGTNNSPNCNNAAFKFDLASLLAKFNTDTEDFTNRGIRDGCYPLTLVFLNESLGGEDFLWEFGEGTVTDQEDSITITYENPGAYPVVLTATDINTCIRESKARGIVTVHDYSFSIIPDDSICGGESIALYASGGVNYDWMPKNSLQNPNSSNPIATPDSTTIYSVKIEDKNGCLAEDSVEIKVIPTVIANFEYEKTYDCFDTPIFKFTNNSENASKFLWDFGDGNISEDSEPVYQYQVSDTVDSFKVTLTSGESFCSNSLSDQITSVKTFIPNFFSPNNDGKNDDFEIIADDQISLHIYNRWGKLVFESLNYQNNWQAGELPSGVYFYEIIFNDKNTRCNGWIQVMR